jgi:hypothetical protein
MKWLRKHPMLCVSRRLRRLKKRRDLKAHVVIYLLVSA